ncbi:uncharacterized protein F5Z01DRAFT_683852 [Emericellopsis atlantica]|uniref:CHY-type domain-containing protein n=1 Tax=Emericellopsis atlantica TaxID=2614577 RepID=A0A9P7ZEX3_9HYPO|nr:uncharacterized protein F5Z01DRAFT_683852 [Emericellopsis atlantica]KAG9250446.1 hypothetical protein F5Z01DRAFT_683852 [Emericellopsis atlantica]
METSTASTQQANAAHGPQSSRRRPRPRDGKSNAAPALRNQAIVQAPTARVVTKPEASSQTKDPREYRIEQIRRRFKPIETTLPDGTTSLLFKLKPSDPDFPFEMSDLECDLRVPKAYPNQKPSLLVKNKNIPKGSSLNVEKGWDNLVEKRRGKGATLLSLVNALDRSMESFLSQKQVETIKLVSFQGNNDAAPQAETSRPVSPKKPAPRAQPSSATTLPERPAAATATRPALPPLEPEPWFKPQQIEEAKARRSKEIRQVDSRMAGVPGYSRSKDGIVFTMPLQIEDRERLPLSLKSVQSALFIVPLLYPLQNLRIHFNEVEEEVAEPIEELFAHIAAEKKDTNLMGYLNYLCGRLHQLPDKVAMAKVEAVRRQVLAPQVSAPKKSAEEKVLDKKDAELYGVQSEKPHVQFIARPPEWDSPSRQGDELLSSESEDTDDGGVDVEYSEEEAAAPMVEETPERGTMLSFPNIALYGIELLQLTTLSLQVKCERCKEMNDFNRLKPNEERKSSCRKCTTPHTATFRPTLIHEHSTRAGFIDLSGCKAADMLPSPFIPTCQNCSSANHELVSVRGESITNVCRVCHAKFTFKIPEVRLLLITPGSLPPPDMPKRKQERLGLRIGEQLPDRGSCAHYKKSYRWFRFSCCNKVYACDKCHDAKEDHINEWANRMLCGCCSREQNYNPEACNYCGRSVIGKKGRGFWEGGKGTRDQRLMSRKDPRKYKRIGTGAAIKKD